MATLPSEQTALAELLQSTFPASHEVNSFLPEVLRWKYFSPHPDWTGPRSYVVKKDESIVGHGGIWPLRFAGANAELSVIHLIDWAASRSATGAGVLLLRKIAGLADLLLTVGGSEETRRILPKLGYQHSGEVKLQVKVVRPWLQFRTASEPGWKAPVRLLRNTLWSLPALPSPPTGWHVSRIARFDSSADPLLNQPKPETLTSIRTIAGLNHILSCPAATFSAFLIFEGARLQGYFVLSQVAGQTRIADIRLAAETPESWKAACVLAARTAAEMPETCEIAAGFSTTLAHEAFEQAGFRVRQTLPIFYHDPRKVLKSVPALDLSLLDSDACFMANLKHPFLT
ncbi:MAG: hypothetical protein WB421_14680 [Terriglobales bacterium]